MEPDDDLGLRILAAVVSYRMGYVGVDSTLKRLREEHGAPSAEFIEAGRGLSRILAERIGSAIGATVNSSDKPM